MRLFRSLTCVTLFAGVLSAFAIPVDAQEESAEPPSESQTEPEPEPPRTTALDENGLLIRFDRDIAPILKSKCLECHGPEDAKNDFRVDDPDSLLGYIEPEDHELSTMYADYLITDDEDMLMPPTSHGGPLSPGELSLIRVWIQEGAEWPSGYEMKADAEGEETPAAPAPPAPETLSERIWAFQGFLHPATIHFPIAFFLLGAVFVVLGWKWPSVGTQIPIACLVLGTLSAVASSLMGWSFAPERGYGSNWSLFDWDREINVHRMSGVIATALSVIVLIVAVMSFWKDSEKLTRYWKIGLLLLAGMIGAVGHQGGELRYGADFYPKAFRILLGDDGQSSAEADSDAEGAADEDATSEDATSEDTADEDTAADDGETVAEEQETAGEDEPASDEPASDEPASDEPASDEPASDGAETEPVTSGQ